LLFRAGLIRALTFYARGRLAIGSIEDEPSRRMMRLAEARRMAGALEREYDEWTGVPASLLRAAAEHAAGNRSAAIEALREGIGRAEATETIGLAIPARYRLGELVGGQEGRTLRDGALTTLRAHGIVDTARWVGVFIPGRWSAAD
jgi:hypothetical protein